MKKFAFAVVLCAAMVAALPVMAQDRGTASEFYYVKVPVEKIYPTGFGYVVTYRAQDYHVEYAVLPFDWFTVGGKAELVTTAGSTWPYLTVFYQNGEFSHVRLYARSDRGHKTWGNVYGNLDIDASLFDPEKDLRLHF
ncbi:hypothetical protein FACS1894172_00660 [Spirochaetia bacterium]|nr:hypothetical protein FACS1894164_07450 [Spirochaetia bacterium]GHU29468.1 hypothetical protein FACS1894172_00660 [Spirochaetia bacterium]